MKLCKFIWFRWNSHSNGFQRMQHGRIYEYGAIDSQTCMWLVTYNETISHNWQFQAHATCNSAVISRTLLSCDSSNEHNFPTDLYRLRTFYFLRNFNRFFFCIGESQTSKKNMWHWPVCTRIYWRFSNSNWTEEFEKLRCFSRDIVNCESMPNFSNRIFKQNLTHLFQLNDDHFQLTVRSVRNFVKFSWRAVTFNGVFFYSFNLNYKKSMLLQVKWALISKL